METLKSHKKPFSQSYAWGRTRINTEPPREPGKNRDWKRALPGLIISVLCLALVFYLADLRRLVNALSLADYRLVAVCAGFSLLWLIVRGVVWRTLLREQATFPQVFYTVNEGYLLNNILPFRLGEVGRAYLLGRKAGMDFWQVFSTIFVERILDVALAFGLLLSTLPFVVGAGWAQQAAMISGAVVVLGLGTLYLAARNQQWCLQSFDRLGMRWPVLLKIGRARLEEFLSGIAVLTNPGRFSLVLFWIILNWSIAIFQYYLLTLAFFPQARFLWSAFTLAVAALGIAAPSSPGAMGVYELTVVGALSLFGLDKSTALAMALTAHLLQYIITSIFGAYGLARDGETLIGLYHSVRRIPLRRIP